MHIAKEEIIIIVYKIDILCELKKKGYNTNVLRTQKILSQSTIQNLRNNKYISFEVLNTICELLEKQPYDIIEYRQNS